MKKFANVKLPKVKDVMLIEDYQFHDRVANGAFVVALLVVMWLVYFVWSNFANLPPEMPFFLSKVVRGERLASSVYVWFIPGVLGMFYLINYAVALMVQKRFLLLARMIAVVTLVLSVLAAYVGWNLIALII